MKILAVSGGNGVIVHPVRKHLIGNIELRSLFTTPGDIQWQLNFPNIPVDKDPNVKYQHPDVIIGAPDCGHSSVLSYSRKKSLSNPKDNKSLTHYVQAIELYKPKIFVMENLPKLLNVMGKDLYSSFRDYRLLRIMKPVSIFGNSQTTRIRLILIGIHLTMPDNTVEKFRIPSAMKRSVPRSEFELISDLPEHDEDLCHVRECETKEVHMWYNGKPKTSLLEVKELWNTDYSELTRWPVHGRVMKTQPGVYRNKRDEPPFTARKSDRQFNHEGLMLTPRELARIQGVPDSFKLWYDPDRHSYSINKARITVTKTPPYELGVYIKQCLNKIF